MDVLLQFDKLKLPPCGRVPVWSRQHGSVETDKETFRRGYDLVRWYLLHKNIHVYIDHDNERLVEFITPFEFLQPDHQCGTCETRPQIHRDHGFPAGTCEFCNDLAQQYFPAAIDLATYFDQRSIDWRWKRLLRLEAV